MWSKNKKQEKEKLRQYGVAPCNSLIQDSSILSSPGQIMLPPSFLTRKV